MGANDPLKMGPLNHQGFPAKGLAFEIVQALPTSPYPGQVVQHGNRMKVWDGTGWVSYMRASDNPVFVMPVDMADEDLADLDLNPDTIIFQRTTS